MCNIDRSQLLFFFLFISPVSDKNPFAKEVHLTLFCVPNFDLTTVSFFQIMIIFWGGCRDIKKLITLNNSWIQAKKQQQCKFLSKLHH